MAGIDPISLAIGGAVLGGVTNKKDPIKGALMGAGLGYGAGSLAAMGSTSTAAGVTGAANPYLAPVVDGTRQAVLTPGGAVVGQGMTPTAMAALDTQNVAAAMAAKGTNPLMMGMMGMNMLNQPQQQTGAPQMKAGQAVDMGDQIGNLLAPKRKKKEQFSLL